MGENSSSDIRETGNKFEKPRSRIVITCGVADGRFGITAASGLINVGKIERKHRVNYVVMFFGKMAAKGISKGFERDAFFSIAAKDFNPVR